MKVPELEEMIEECEKTAVQLLDDAELEQAYESEARWLEWATEQLRMSEELRKSISYPTPQEHVQIVPGVAPYGGVTWETTINTSDTSGGRWINTIPTTLTVPQLGSKTTSLKAPLIEHSVRYIK